MPYSGQALINSQGAKIGAFATITVCPITSGGAPCSPKASIYSSPTGTSGQAANPFSADQNGNFSFYAAPNPYLVSVSFGQTNYSYPITVGLGSEGLTVFSVKSYGAMGDGTTDDTAAIQGAFTAADAVCGIVLFPPGVYLTSSPVTSYRYCTSIEGSGKEGAAIIDYTGTSGGAIQFEPPVFSNVRGGFIKDLAIGCGTSSPTNATQAGPSDSTIGLLMYSILGRFYQDIVIGGCGDGIQLYQTPNDYTEESKFSQVMLINNFYGLHLNAVNGAGGGGSSYGYTKFEGYCQTYSTQGGACIRNDYGWLYNSTISLRANELANAASLSADLIEVGDYGKMDWDDVHIYSEGSTGNPAIAVGPLGQVDSGDGSISLDGHQWGAIPFMPTAQGGSIAWIASTAYAVGTFIQPSGCNSGYGYLMVQTAGTSGITQPSWNCTTLDQMTTDGGVTWRFVGLYPGSNGAIYPAIATTLSGPIIINPYQYIGTPSYYASPSAIHIETQQGISESIQDQDANGGIGFVLGANTSHPIAYGYQNDSYLFEVDKKNFETPLTSADREWYIDAEGNMWMSGAAGTVAILHGSAVPTGNCTVYGNGALYSNTGGTTGTTLYVCVSGSWVDIK